MSHFWALALGHYQSPNQGQHSSNSCSNVKPIHGVVCSEFSGQNQFLVLVFVIGVDFVEQEILVQLLVVHVEVEGVRPDHLLLDFVLELGDGEVLGNHEEDLVELVFLVFVLDYDRDLLLVGRKQLGHVILPFALFHLFSLQVLL